VKNKIQNYNQSTTINQLENKIFLRLKSLAPIAILVSGGADSSLLAEIARRTLNKNSFYLIHAILPFSPHKETERIKSYASQYDLNLISIPVDLMKIKNIVSNSKKKCYYCKKYIITSILNSDMIPDSLTLCDGTVTDDFRDFRPGLQATSELSINHPLADSGFSKKEIRRLARYYKIPNWNLPASACLASRIPVNQIITKNKLKKIAQAEDYLTNLGFSGCRVRFINSDTAKIEVFYIYLNKLKKNFFIIEKKFKLIGFKNIIIDEKGYTKGAMNNPL